MSDVFRRNPGVQIVTATQGNAMVASASRMTGSLTDHLIQNREWQREAWDFYHAMGEFWYGVTWLANMCSRVRLGAGKKVDGGDEPELLKIADATGNDAKAVDAVASLGGGIGGHAVILKSLTVKLNVPGEAYVVGEQLSDPETGELGPYIWETKSSDEIRRREIAVPRRKRDASRGIDPLNKESTPSPFEVQIEEGRWRQLADESIVCRVWNPDEQYSWRACSAALPALPILRELDLLNRRIIAELVSRVAMNGFLVIPDEVTFLTRPEFKDAADPFMAELIDVASKAIKTPGSAAATLPIPLKVPGQWVDKIQHIKIADFLDPKLMEDREKVIKRLATTLNMPSEVLLGVADVNHWTAWQIDEQGIKTHIVPNIETICQGLTKSFLRPILLAAGVPVLEVDQYVVWYDVSEITSKPDLTQAAKDNHAVMAISDEALRRETGFNDDDAPTKDELKTQLLVALALQGNIQAFKELTGVDLTAPPPPGLPGIPGVPPGSPGGANGANPGPVNQGNVVKAPPPAQQPSSSANGRVPTPTGA